MSIRDHFKADQEKSALASFHQVIGKRRRNRIESSLKSAIAFLILASASFVEAQTIQTLCSFNATNGYYPNAALTLGNDGNFYGTTEGGGSYGNGTVFKMTANGTLTTLVSFFYTNGANPYAGLTLGNDGSFYGTTGEGGITNSMYRGGAGTVFRVTPGGALTTLVSFATNNGVSASALTLGNDGSFYGTTAFGGYTNLNSGNGYGTVFKMATNGTLTTLASFSNTNGAQPSALTLGNDGNFYGTTFQGGTKNWGTVFRISTNGALTKLVDFNLYNGAQPEAALTLGNDGNFYGTTFSRAGTVFRVTPGGALTTLVSFSGTDGAGPQAALTLGNDGSFYGTTGEGGITNLNGGWGYGTVFKISTNGTLTSLYSFTGGNDGATPVAGLVQGNDGNFYGTTSNGGITNSIFKGGMGTVFRLLLRPLITVQPQSQTNNAGATETFFVSATSLQPIGYQWQKSGTNLVDGGNISGATASTLTITDISDGDAASYSVIVSNSYGAVTSSNAVLTVNDSLFIASQPQSQSAGLGSNVRFTVTVYGAAPFVFQWYFNGAPVGSPAPGTNFSSYALTHVGTNQAGNYSVEIFNGHGSLMSSNAVLTVIIPPTLALQLFAGYPLLNLEGILSNNFVVQYSTNLAGTNWINLLSLTNLQSSPYLFLDPAGDSAPARFYRAFIQ